MSTIAVNQRRWCCEWTHSIQSGQCYCRYCRQFHYLTLRWHFHHVQQCSMLSHSQHTVTHVVVSRGANGRVTALMRDIKSGTSEHKTPFLMSSIADRLSHSSRTVFTTTTMTAIGSTSHAETSQWHTSRVQNTLVCIVLDTLPYRADALSFVLPACSLAHQLQNNHFNL